MHILVTNDDGVDFPGLLALVQAMKTVGTVSVLAPDHNWSASGHVKTLHRPLRAREILLADGTPALASDGAPSDCVALALMGLVPEKIDLVVSGINPYANLGHDLTYSGTVTAAMEGAIAGIPAIAVSLDSRIDSALPRDYTGVAQVAAQVAASVLLNGLPKGICLNLNVPDLPYEQLKGWRITRQGLRVYHDELVRRVDPRGHPYYWIGGAAPTGIPDEGTDYGALMGGFISITPIQLDLTAHDLIGPLSQWNWE